MLRRGMIGKNVYRKLMIMLLLLQEFSVECAAQNVRIKFPVKEGLDVGLIIVPGAYLDYFQYNSIAELIQEWSERRLWVYLADGPLNEQDHLPASRPRNNVDHAATRRTLGSAWEELITAGMPADAPFFAAGHSLGGVIIQAESFEFSNITSGLVLWGATVEYRFEEFLCPVLTQSGEMDGQMKVMRVLDVNRELLEEIEEGDTELKYYFPTNIMISVNHAQYATGDMPPLVLDQDLPSDIPDEEARNIIAHGTATFIDYHSRNTSDDSEALQAIMDDWHSATLDIAQPIFTIYDLEKHPDTNVSEWSRMAQNLVSGLTSEDLPSLLVTDLNVPNDVLASFQPTINTTVEGDVEVTTITSVAESFLGEGYMSAFMLETKMKSSQAVKEALYQTDQPEDVDFTCKQTNMEAWQLAWDILPQRNRDRFNNSEAMVFFEDDIEEVWGPGWVVSELIYDFNRTLLELTLQSTSLWTSTSQEFEVIPAGMYYCKMLSPARAFEFMYIDSLRRRYPL